MTEVAPRSGWGGYQPESGNPATAFFPQPGAAGQAYATGFVSGSAPASPGAGQNGYPSHRSGGQPGSQPDYQARYQPEAGPAAAGSGASYAEQIAFRTSPGGSVPHPTAQGSGYPGSGNPHASNGGDYPPSSDPPSLGQGTDSSRTSHHGGYAAEVGYDTASYRTQLSGAQAAAPTAPPASSRQAARAGQAPAGGRRGARAVAGYPPRLEEPYRPVEPGPRTAAMAIMTPPPSSTAPMRGRHATQWDQGFGGVVSWTLLGSVFPGAGLLAAGRKAAGFSIIGLWVLTGTAAVALVAFGDPITLLGDTVLSHPEWLTYLAYGLVAMGVLWAIHVIGTHAALRRFAELTGGQRALSLVLVATLVIGGVATSVYGGQQVLAGRDTLTAIFSGDPTLAAKRLKGTAADPWANKPRVNLLLIGSDAGADRTGVRTDTLIVASIDTKTGRAVLLSLPRNLEHVPFPAGTQQAVDYPEGYACPDDSCMINALWQFGVEHKNAYYTGDPNPGLTATTQGVQEALGLTVDYYAMVDLRGFMQFVDAIGGVTINVARRLPVGGKRNAAGQQVGVTSYIPAGKQKLNGYEALWYARSRSDSDDFERMSRQRCVIGAITQQADPKTVALHLPAVMKAAKDNIRTDIPLQDVNAWVTLATRVKSVPVRSLTFTDAVIAPGNPDFDKMHRLVQEALVPPPVAATPSPSTATSPSPSGSGKATPSPKVAIDPDAAVDVSAVC